MRAPAEIGSGALRGICRQARPRGVVERHSIASASAAGVGHHRAAGVDRAAADHHVAGATEQHDLAVMGPAAGADAIAGQAHHIHAGGATGSGHAQRSGVERGAGVAIGHHAIGAELRAAAAAQGCPAARLRLHMPGAEQAEEAHQLGIGIIFDDDPRAAQVLLGEAVDHHGAHGAARVALGAINLHAAARVSVRGGSRQASVILCGDAGAVLDVGASVENRALAAVGLLVKGSGPGAGANGGIGGAGAGGLVAAEPEALHHALGIECENVVQFLPAGGLDDRVPLGLAFRVDLGPRAQGQAGLGECAGANFDLGVGRCVGGDVGPCCRDRCTDRQERFAGAGAVVAVAGRAALGNVKGLGITKGIQASR